MRPVLMDLQHGQCFYCAKELRSGGHVDHFVPWGRYPVDLGHNFVLADDRCNSAKAMLLAAEEHLARWSERNTRYATDIDALCVNGNLRADFGASNQIVRWAYGQALTTGAMAWVRANELRRLGPDWASALAFR